MGADLKQYKCQTVYIYEPEGDAAAGTFIDAKFRDHKFLTTTNTCLRCGCDRYKPTPVSEPHTVSAETSEFYALRADRIEG